MDGVVTLRWKLVVPPAETDSTKLNGYPLPLIVVPLTFKIAKSSSAVTRTLPEKLLALLRVQVATPVAP